MNTFFGQGDEMNTSVDKKDELNTFVDNPSPRLRLSFVPSVGQEGNA